ncbi:MAG TPA: hypothetical protein VN366_13330, partial [Feifaniaceae bacterium]|nr:hypothetical protein [Feifaniaceae bacterium]
LFPINLTYIFLIKNSHRVMQIKLKYSSPCIRMGEYRIYGGKNPEVWSKGLNYFPENDDI